MRGSVIRCWTILMTLCIWVCSVKTQTSGDLKELISDVFDSYSNKIRPVLYQSDPLNLDVSFYLSSITEVNEVKEKLVTTGFLELSWTDEHLTWTPSDYNNTQEIFVPQNDIWKPDLVLKNGFKKFEEIGGSFYYMMIASDGNVVWQPFQVFETRCSMNIYNFPFDSQSCDIKFVTWSHFADQIEITKSSKGIQFYEYEENSVWNIKGTSSVIKKEGIESEIKFTIKLQRKPQYYIMNIILPVVFLGYLNILVFVIPVDAGEKMSFSVTVFLSFAVFLTIISTLLPTSSENIPIIAMYLVIQLINGVFALIISAFQLRLRHRDEHEEISNLWTKIINLQQKMRCKRRPIVKVEPLDSSISDMTFGWNHVASSIDFFAFWSFLVTNVIINIIMFSMAATD
ncbi:neuronal acetylcholine receptor subunit alpha-6-like [Crassostrea virginica]